MEGEEKPGEGGFNTATPTAREATGEALRTVADDLQKGERTFRVNPNMLDNLTPDEQEAFLFEGKIPSNPKNEPAVEKRPSSPPPPKGPFKPPPPLRLRKS